MKTDKKASLGQLCNEFISAEAPGENSLQKTGCTHRLCNGNGVIVVIEGNPERRTRDCESEIISASVITSLTVGGFMWQKYLHIQTHTNAY